MKGRTPTKAEREWLGKVADLGCIVCLNHHYTWSPASPHHMEGRTKEGCHFLTIPLCGIHHQTGGEGVAFHATGRKTWEKRFGTEKELLQQCKDLINEQ